MQFHREDASLISFSSKSERSDRKDKLKIKLKKFSDENAKLKETLVKKNAEVASLNELKHSLEVLSLDSSSNSNAKIVELSKKNRNINAELHSLKSKLKTLDDNNKHLEQIINQKDEKLKQLSTSALLSKPSEIQLLSDKLEKANKRVFDVLNQNSFLKNELLTAQKCLEQELGETVSSSLLLSENSNWRGRAYEIALLNKKNKELRDKINRRDDCYESDSLPVRKSESMRRIKVDLLTKELDDCKCQLDDVKQKFCQLKSRNKNLNDNANGYKLKTLDLLEKSNRDEEFIKSLNEQISMIKYEYDNKINKLKEIIEQAESLKQENDYQVKDLNYQIDNQRDILKQKDTQIENLKISIEKLEQNIRDVSGDFIFSPQMSQDNFAKLLKDLEEEKNNILSQSIAISARLRSEASKVSEQHETIQKKRLKIARLEGRIKELESEKEASMPKNRRIMRISNYSKQLSSLSLTNANERFSTEIDKHKFKLEVAMERVDFLEKKLKQESKEHQEDSKYFSDIIGKSKEIFKSLFDKNAKDVTEHDVRFKSY